MMQQTTAERAAVARAEAANDAARRKDPQKDVSGKGGLGYLEKKGKGKAPQPQDKTTWGGKSTFGEAMSEWRESSGSDISPRAAAYKDSSER